MKYLMLSTALLAAGGTSAFAQDAGAMFRTNADATEVRASDFIGKRVYSSETAITGDAFDGAQPDWEDIGEIGDVLMSRAGKVDGVIVDIGGFLGMGERHVAIDMSAVRFVGDNSTPDDPTDYFLVMNAPRAALEAAPEYGMQANTAMAPATATDTTATDTTATNSTATDTTATDMTATGGTATDTTAAAPDTTATDMTGVATDTNATDMTATNDTATTAPDVAANDPVLSPHTPIVRDGYSAAAPADLTSEMLTGAKVYDANDEWIGEISQLNLSDSGQVTEAIVDVGGFLGIGEKPVAMKIADLDILRNADGSDLRVYVSATKDQMEAMPTYAK